MPDINQWLGEQEWYQQIKAKWDEQDQESKSYLQIAAVGLVTAFVLYLVLSFIWGVHTLKREVDDKSQLLLQLQSANEDLQKLRSANSSLSAIANPDNGPWPPYFEGYAGQIGISHENLSVSESKAGTTNDLSKEALYDVTVKKVNVHQLVRFAYALETGSRPVKLRNLTINTQPDLSGYLDATLSVSAFTLLNTTK
ncbi:MAG: hypothetical protein P4M08_07690 [Oligoflexia bacterium]|nr:hypothetical protein [Oligoflexia bacterium]